MARRRVRRGSVCPGSVTMGIMFLTIRVKSTVHRTVERTALSAMLRMPQMRAARPGFAVTNVMRDITRRVEHVNVTNAATVIQDVRTQAQTERVRFAAVVFGVLLRHAAAIIRVNRMVRNAGNVWMVKRDVLEQRRVPAPVVHGKMVRPVQHLRMETQFAMPAAAATAVIPDLLIMALLAVPMWLMAPSRMMVWRVVILHVMMVIINREAPV